MAIGSQNTVAVIYVVYMVYMSWELAHSTWLDCTTRNWTCNIRELVTVTTKYGNTVVYIHIDGTDEQKHADSHGGYEGKEVWCRV